MVQFYKFIHTFSLFCQAEKVYKAKEEQIYPFFHSIHPFAPHPLAQPEIQNGGPAGLQPVSLTGNFRGKGLEQGYRRRRAESFCSYIRRALISKSEGVLLPYRDNPPSDTLCHRKTRCPPPMLHSTGCPVTIRPVSDRSSLSYKSIPLSFELSAPIGDVSRRQTSRGGKHDKCTIAILRQEYRKELLYPVSNSTAWNAVFEGARFLCNRGNIRFREIILFFFFFLLFTEKENVHIRGMERNIIGKILFYS